MAAASVAAEIHDRWSLTNGLLVEGPSSFSALARSMASGRVQGPLLVRHESWRVWRPFDEVRALNDAQRCELVRRLSTQAGSGDPLRFASSRPAMALAQVAAPRSLRPTPIDSVGVLHRARSLEEAWLLTVGLCAAAISASVVLLHAPTRDGAYEIVGSFGPGTESWVGQELGPAEPLVRAISAKTLVVADPLEPSGAGAELARRMEPILEGVRGAALVPFILGGEPMGALEVGRRSRAFTARELGRVEELLEVLGERCIVAGWLD